MACSDRRQFRNPLIYPLVTTVVDTAVCISFRGDISTCYFGLAPDTFEKDCHCVLLRFEDGYGGRTLEGLSCRLKVNYKVHYGVRLTVIDLTSHVREYANGIHVSISAKRYPVKVRMYVQIVKKLDNCELLSLAFHHRDARLEASVTRSLATSILAAGDTNDEKVVEVRVSLICPLLRTRIVVPSRGVNCKHLQCFDASGYLRLNENTLYPRWRCPVCDRTLTVGEIRVDLFTLDVLESAPKSCEQVQVLQDGLWKPVEERRNIVLHLDACFADLTHDTSLCALE